MTQNTGGLGEARGSIVVDVSQLRDAGRIVEQVAVQMTAAFTMVNAQLQQMANNMGAGAAKAVVAQLRLQTAEINAQASAARNAANIEIAATRERIAVLQQDSGARKKQASDVKSAYVEITVAAESAMKSASSSGKQFDAVLNNILESAKRLPSLLVAPAGNEQSLLNDSLLKKTGDAVEFVAAEFSNASQRAEQFFKAVASGYGLAYESALELLGSMQKVGQVSAIGGAVDIFGNIEAAARRATDAIDDYRLIVTGEMRPTGGNLPQRLGQDDAALAGFLRELERIQSTEKGVLSTVQTINVEAETRQQIERELNAILEQQIERNERLIALAKEHGAIKDRLKEAESVRSSREPSADIGYVRAGLTGTQYGSLLTRQTDAMSAGFLRDLDAIQTRETQLAAQAATATANLTSSVSALVTAENDVLEAKVAQVEQASRLLPVQQRLADSARVRAGQETGELAALRGSIGQPRQRGTLGGRPTTPAFIQFGLYPYAGIAQTFGATGVSNALMGAGNVLGAVDAIAPLNEGLSRVAARFQSFGGILGSLGATAVAATGTLTGTAAALGAIAIVAAPFVILLGGIAFALNRFSEAIKDGQKVLEGALAAQETYYGALSEQTTDQVQQEIQTRQRRQTSLQLQLTETRGASEALFAQMAAQYGDFLAREYFDSANKPLADRISELETALSENSGAITRLTDGVNSGAFIANDRRVALERGQAAAFSARQDMIGMPNADFLARLNELRQQAATLRQEYMNAPIGSELREAIGKMRQETEAQLAEYQTEFNRRIPSFIADAARAGANVVQAIVDAACARAQELIDLRADAALDVRLNLEDYNTQTARDEIASLKSDVTILRAERSTASASRQVELNNRIQQLEGRMAELQSQLSAGNINAPSTSGLTVGGGFNLKASAAKLAQAIREQIQKNVKDALDVVAELISMVADYNAETARIRADRNLTDGASSKTSSSPVPARPTISSGHLRKRRRISTRPVRRRKRTS